jgi:hypothetical protein
MIRADHVESIGARGSNCGEVIFGIDKIARWLRLQIPRTDAARHFVALPDQ